MFGMSYDEVLIVMHLMQWVGFDTPTEATNEERALYEKIKNFVHNYNHTHTVDD